METGKKHELSMDLQNSSIVLKLDPDDNYLMDLARVLANADITDIDDLKKRLES